MGDGNGNGNGSGRRWYDPSKMVITLFGIVAFFLIAWGGFVFTLAYGATTVNTRQDEQLKAIMEKFDASDKRQTRMEEKLDRVLERLK